MLTWINNRYRGIQKLGEGEWVRSTWLKIRYTTTR